MEIGNHPDSQMTTQLDLDKWQMKKNTDDICKNYHGGNPMSVKANAIAHKYKISARQRIIETLQDDFAVSNYGLICEDLERLTGLSHQTCSARCTEALRDGLIVKIGQRKTRSGCMAAVYSLAK